MNCPPSLTLVLLFLLSKTSLADLRVVCPTDSTLYAYDSIASINNDILSEVQSIEGSPLVVAKPFYNYTFCPNTIFDGNDRLTPLLNASYFICGANGDSTDNCTITGGQMQIFLTETGFSSIQYVAFHGLTLDSSTGYGVAAFGSNASTVEFFDCHWKNNSGIDSPTQGGSSIHIVYDEYVPPASRTREVNYVTDVSAPNIFHHGVTHGRYTMEINGENIIEPPNSDRRLQEILQTGMNVHLYNSSITGGFKTDTITYRAVFSEGFLLFDNVTIQNNHGGLLCNIVGGNAVLEGSTFTGNTMSAAIRVTNGASIMVQNTNFVQNTGIANVVVIASTATIESCGFLDNVLETAEVFATTNSSASVSIGSTVEISNSCIIGSSVWTAIFSDEFSNTTGVNNFGENLTVFDICGDSTANTSIGIIFRESAGFSCFQDSLGLANCEGVCEPFDANVCALPANGLTLAPSAVPSTSPTRTPTYPSTLLPTMQPFLESIPSNANKTASPASLMMASIVPTIPKTSAVEVSTRVTQWVFATFILTFVCV